MNGIWEFFKRNIFTIVLIVTLLVAMPWLSYIFIVPAIILLIGVLVISWKVYQLRKSIYNEAQRRQGATNNQQHRREGDVTVVQTEQTEQKVNDDIGEYVEFKEIKDRDN